MNVIDVFEKLLNFEISNLDEIIKSKDATSIGIQMIFVVALSTSLYQSIILFANKIKFPRFVLSITINIVTYIISTLFEIFLIMLIGNLFLEKEIIFIQIFTIVSISFAPRVLNVFALTPYLGEFLNKLFFLASFLLVVFLTSEVLGIPTNTALFVTFIAIVVEVFIDATIGKPVNLIQKKIKNFIAGTNIKQVKEVFKMYK